MSAPHGILASFADAERLAAAVRSVRAAGYRRLDVYAPFPLPELAGELGWTGRALPWIAAGAGLVGAAVQYGAQWWMNAVDYPIDVGGRPLHAWPAFVPATVIVAILWAAATTLLAMLVLTRLPRLHHPLFAVPAFRRASQDRFFLCVRADDPGYHASAVAALLAGLGADGVEEVVS